jgi:hypothetical protein
LLAVETCTQAGVVTMKFNEECNNDDYSRSIRCVDSSKFESQQREMSLLTDKNVSLHGILQLEAR